jgi:nucleotide-binding universal stress UspA family protein
LDDELGSPGARAAATLLSMSALGQASRLTASPGLASIGREVAVLVAADCDGRGSMYRKIILAYDGSLEGRRALREGAVLASRLGSEVFLLAVLPAPTGSRMAEGVHPGPVAHHETTAQGLLDDALHRLKELGVTARGQLEQGEPVPTIAAWARRIGADLIVLGHRRRGLLERWWSGGSGAFLAEQVDCSVLVGRQEVTDEEFRSLMHEP